MLYMPILFMSEMCYILTQGSRFTRCIQLLLFIYPLYNYIQSTSCTKKITQHTSRGCLSVSHSIQYYHNILTSSFKGTVLFHLLLMIDAGISELESTNSLMRGLNSLVICATLWIMQLPRKNQLNLVLTNKNNISIHAATDQNAFLLRKLSSHCC